MAIPPANVIGGNIPDEYHALNEEGAMGPEIGTGPLYGTGIPSIDIDLKDFPFLEAVNQGKTELPESDGMNDNSQGDETADYTELISNEALIGEYSLDTIIEGITNQFNSYIGTEDRTDYVDIFYDEIHNSYAAITADEGEEHPAELREVLDKILNQFVSSMQQLFEQRLSLTIIDLDAEEIDHDEIEYVIRKLYEFFILGAKENFIKVITSDINSKIKTVIDDDKKFYDTVTDMLNWYSPLVLCIGPMEFLRYTGNEDVYELFQEGRVVGNFLRKYSPKLYQYEEFKVELVSHIVISQEVKEEILNGGHE